MKNALPRYMAVAASLSVVTAVFVTGCGDGGRDREPVVTPELETGMAKLRANDFAGAVAPLEKAAHDRPLDASVQCNLGVACWKLGRTAQAVNAFQKAAGGNGCDARPLEFLARVLMDTGDWRGAREALEEARERLADSPRILTALAVAEIRTDGTNAIAGLEQALAIRPDYTPALYNIAIALHNRAASLPASAAQAKRDDRQAADYCRKYLDLMEARPDSGTTPETARRMAAARKLLASLTGARISTPPPPPPARPPRALLQRARRAVAQNAYEAALILLKDAIKEDPSNPDALWELALVYDKHLKYPDSAAETYKEFEKRFPNDPRKTPAPR